MADRRHQRARRDDGVVVVLTALAMTAVLVIAALVVDVGYAKQARREAQGAADSAALAAAQAMAAGDGHAAAATAARDVASSSLGPLTAADWAGCVDPARPAGYTVQTAGSTGGCVSFDDANRRVRVVLPTVTTPGFFGRAVERDSYDITAEAVGEYASVRTGMGDCGVCGIDGAEFQQAGNSTIKIDDGRQIQADRMRINTNNNANDPRSAGWWLINESNNDKYTYQQLTGPVVNPFASVTVDYSGVTMHPEMNARCQNLEPNKMYRQSVNIDSACTLTESGIYYFRNGINVNGNLSTASGVRVTLVFGCATGTEMSDRPRSCAGSHTGNVNISGGLQLGEPYYGGVSLLWDETASGSSVINYNGNIKLGGAYYSRGATPAFGNGTFEATAVVFGGTNRAATVNGGNIRIVAPQGDGAQAGDARIGLWR